MSTKGTSLDYPVVRRRRWRRNGMRCTEAHQGLAPKQPENSLAIGAASGHEIAYGKISIKCSQPMENTCGIPKRENDQEIYR